MKNAFDEMYQEGWSAGFGYGVMVGCAVTGIAALIMVLVIK